MLFTATWPKSVQKMAGKYLVRGEPAEAAAGAAAGGGGGGGNSSDYLVHITVGSQEELVANKDVSQLFYELDDSVSWRG